MLNQHQHEQHETNRLLEKLVERHDTQLTHLARVRDELASTNGIVRRGAEPRELINGASMRMSASPGQLAGFALRETSGTAGATVRIRDGGALGSLLLPLSLAANESARDWYLPHGIGFVNGLYVEVVDGAVEGTIFLGPFGR